jgi:hypothetical protein
MKKIIRIIINRVIQMFFGGFMPKINMGMMIRIEEARQTQLRAGEGE